MTSGWSIERCISRPLDDRSLTAVTPWQRTSSPYAYFNTLTRSSTRSATLSRSSIRTKRIALVATTCATCGSVDILWNGAFLKRQSLTTSTTRTKQIMPIATFSSIRTGTLSIRVDNTGRFVTIDGLGLSSM